MAQRSVLRTSLLLVLTLCLVFPTALAQLQIREKPLTNAQIVEMVKANLSAEEIIAKIQVSRCHFDTNPSVLAELKYRGVPDAIIIAMSEAPYGAPRNKPQSSETPAKEIDVAPQSSEQAEPKEHEAGTAAKQRDEGPPPPVPASVNVPALPVQNLPASEVSL